VGLPDAATTSIHPHGSFRAGSRLRTRLRRAKLAGTTRYRAYHHRWAVASGRGNNFDPPARLLPRREPSTHKASPSQAGRDLPAIALAITGGPWRPIRHAHGRPDAATTSIHPHGSFRAGSRLRTRLRRAKLARTTRYRAYHHRWAVASGRGNNFDRPARLLPRRDGPDHLPPSGRSCTRDATPVKSGYFPNEVSRWDH
jgi:hypothetical protein